jgi:hypothetical protein
VADGPPQRHTMEPGNYVFLSGIKKKSGIRKITELEMKDMRFDRLTNMFSKGYCTV